MNLLSKLLSKVDFAAGYKRAVGGVATAIAGYLMIRYPDAPKEAIVEVLYWGGSALLTWGMACATARKLDPK